MANELNIKVGFDISDAERAVNDLTKKLEHASSELNATEREISRVENDIEKLNRQREEEGSLDDKQTKRLEAQTERLDDLNRKHAKQVELVQSLNQQLEVAKENLANMKSNLIVGEGLDFKSVNSRLNELKNTLSTLKDKEHAITEEIKQQEELYAEILPKLQQLTELGLSTTNDEQTKAVADQAIALEENIERLKNDLADVRAQMGQVQEQFQQIAHFPLSVNKEGFESATNDAKQIDAILKNIQATASEISFPKMDLVVDDGKLQSLIDKYNQLATQYNTQSAKVAKLRAQVEELHRIEAEQSKTGAVSPDVLSRLTDYSNKLAEAEAKLASLGHKTENARTAVTEYAEELERSQSVAGKVSDYISNQMSKIGNTFERITTRLKNMLFRFVVMRTLYAAFNSLKNIMSSIISENDSLGNSINQLKSNLLVAFYPVINLMAQGLEKLVNWLIKATQYVGAFIHAITGANIQDSIEGAKKLYDAMNADKTAKAEKKDIDAKIKEKQREIKALEEQAKAIKKEYETEKLAINRKKDALEDEIKSINLTITALRRQESAEKKAAQALKESIQEQIDALRWRKKERERDLSDQKNAVDAEIKAIEKEIKALKKQKEAREDEIKEQKRTLAGFDTLQVLSDSSAKDTEVKNIEDQIDALEEKKDVLQETKDAIPTGTDDPLVRQIEDEIEALQRQKDAIKDVDYSSMIEQQQDIIQGFKDQKEKLNELLEKLQDKYNFKIDGIDEAKQKIQDAITKLQEEKAEIESARNEAAKPQKFNIDFKNIDGLKEKLKWIEDHKNGVVAAIGAIGGAIALLGVAFGNPFAIVGGISLAIATIKKQFETLKGKAELVFKVFFKDLLPNAWKKFTDWLYKVGSKLQEKVDNANKKLNEAWEKFTSWLTNGVHSLGEKISEAWSNFWDSLNQGFNGLADGTKRVLNTMIGLLETAINWLVDKLPDWAVKGIEGVFHVDISHITLPRLEVAPLAQGAVLPGGKPFLAMLGDQPAGQTNIETPEKLLRQIVREELGQMQVTPNVDIHFDGNLSQLARILQPYIEVANKRASAFA